MKVLSEQMRRGLKAKEWNGGAWFKPHSSIVLADRDDDLGHHVVESIHGDSQALVPQRRKSPQPSSVSLALIPAVCLKRLTR